MPPKDEKLPAEEQRLQAWEQYRKNQPLCVVYRPYESDIVKYTYFGALEKDSKEKAPLPNVKNGEKIEGTNVMVFGAQGCTLDKNAQPIEQGQVVVNIKALPRDMQETIADEIKKAAVSKPKDPLGNMGNACAVRVNQSFKEPGKNG